MSDYHGASKIVKPKLEALRLAEARLHTSSRRKLVVSRVRRYVMVINARIDIDSICLDFTRLLLCAIVITFPI